MKICPLWWRCTDLAGPASFKQVLLCGFGTVCVSRYYIQKSHSSNGTSSVPKVSSPYFSKPGTKRETTEPTVMWSSNNRLGEVKEEQALVSGSFGEAEYGNAAGTKVWFPRKVSYSPPVLPEWSDTTCNWEAVGKLPLAALSCYE